MKDFILGMLNWLVGLFVVIPSCMFFTLFLLHVMCYILLGVELLGYNGFLTQYLRELLGLTNFGN